MNKFIEIVLMLTIAACSWTVAIMLIVCTLPTTLDCVILYIIATMFAIGGTIAFVQFSHLWHSMFKQVLSPFRGFWLTHLSLASLARLRCVWANLDSFRGLTDLTVMSPPALLSTNLCHQIQIIGHTPPDSPG